MTTIPRRLFPIVLTVLLAGCSTPTNLPPIDLSTPPGVQRARLVVFRTSQIAGSGTFPEIQIDGEKRGSLLVGSYMIFELPVGGHSVVASGNFVTFPFPKAEAQITLEEGNDYYLMFETDLVDMNTVVSRWKNGFYLVSADFGKAAIQKLKRRA